MNLTGLSATGIDIDKIVSQLVALQRQPISRLQQKQNVYTAHTQALQGIIDKLSSFKSAALALRDASLFKSAQKVTSSDNNLLTGTLTGNAAPGGYSFVVSDLARAQQQVSDPSFVTATQTDTLNIQVGAEPVVGVPINAGDSLQVMADKINAAVGIDTYASVMGGKLYLSGKMTGSANTINVSSVTSLAADMGLTVSQTAINANFTINGTTYNNKSTNTISDILPGITFSLKSTGTSSLTVDGGSVDTEAIAAKLQSFVDKYNEVVNSIYDKLEEQPHRNPLTESQRAQGALRGNTMLLGLLNSLRQQLSHTVGGLPASTNELKDLGIQVARGSGGATTTDAKRGILSFDKTAFLNTFNADPANTQLLMTNSTGAAATEGLAQYFDRIINPYVKVGGILDNAKQGNTSQISLLDRRITEMQSRLKMYEENLRRQLSNMEASIISLQSQQGFLG